MSRQAKGNRRDRCYRMQNTSWTNVADKTKGTKEIDGIECEDKLLQTGGVDRTKGTEDIDVNITTIIINEF